KTFKFKNTRAGFKTFNEWLLKVCEKHEKTEIIAGLEPTGHYWFNLGRYLKDNNIAIAMVNPYHVKQTKELDNNSQTKNDTKDPKVIAKLVKLKKC
ncbi:MAG: IS110 family transposase, partial [Fusobacteriia bacterium 4572_74]